MRTVILDHAVLTKKDDETVRLLLNSRVGEKGHVGDVGFFNGELAEVFSEISIDKNVTVVLMGNSIRSSENLKDVALGGNADLDFLFW